MITPPRLPPRLRFLRLLLPVAALAGFLVVVMAAGLLVVGQFVGGGEEGEEADDVRGGDGRAAVGGRPADLGGARRGAAPDRGHDHRRRQGHGDPAAGLGGRPGHGDAGVADGHRRHGRRGGPRLARRVPAAPSQGWGSPEQVRDPVYATRTFLERLLTVPGWDTMPVTRAAQIVQRSAFPNAYAKWESLANSLVTDLAGVTGAIQECVPAAQAGPGPAAALAARRRAHGDRVRDGRDRQALRLGRHRAEQLRLLRADAAGLRARRDRAAARLPRPVPRRRARGRRAGPAG